MIKKFGELNERFISSFEEIRFLMKKIERFEKLLCINAIVLS